MDQTLKGYVNANSSGNLQHWDNAEWNSGTWLETDVILGRNLVVNSSVLSSVTTQSSLYANRAFISIVNGVSNVTSNIYLILTMSGNISSESDVYARFTTWLAGSCNSISGPAQVLLTKAYSISSTSSAVSILGAYLSKNKYMISDIDEISNVIGNITLPNGLHGAITATSGMLYINLSRIVGFISDINATTHITARPLSTQTTEEYRLVPLSKYIFDNAVLSLQMNSEMSNIYRWLDGLTHGTDIVYGGRYKVKFNKTLNTLDIVYNKQMFTYNGNGDRDYNTTADTVVARIFSNGNVSIKGTLTQSASL